MQESPVLSSAELRLSSPFRPTTMSAATRAADDNTNLAWRKSCDFCYLHKKRCDGGGVSPCRRCARKGGGHACMYSRRKRKTGRRQSRDSLPEATQTSSDTEIAGAQTFKRPGFSASAATGLIGMRENALLNDFFECVGFLPFTTTSNIQRTMVMVIIVFKQDPAPSRSICAMQDSEEDCSGVCRGPSMCTFWCALAIGGLAKGQTMEAVDCYVLRAEAAVKGFYESPATFELARAYNILAYMYGLGKKIERYHHYSHLAAACLQAASREGSDNDVQVGFVELVQHQESVKRFTANLGSDDIEELCNKDLGSPQISDYANASEGEMYRFFMHTYKALEQAFFLDLSGHGQRTEEKAHSVVLDAVVCRLQTCLREFERLENAVDRPHIKKSVGGFLINCMLVFVKASKGDIEGALDRSSLCIDFVERYPGFSSWMHTSHILASVLETMSHEQPRARELYETLRVSYNPARGKFPAMPPLEEWEKDSLECGNFYCRSMTWVISSNEIPFSSVQRCHHAAPEIEMKIEKADEGLDHHQNGYGCGYGCTTEVDDLLFSYVDDAAPRTIRAVSPTSSNDSNEHEAWSTETEFVCKTEEEPFAVEFYEAMTGSKSIVVPMLPLEPSSPELDGPKLEEKTPMNEFRWDSFVDFNVKMNEKAPPSSFEALKPTTTRAPTPIPSGAIFAPDKNVVAPLTWGAVGFLEETFAMQEATSF